MRSKVCQFLLARTVLYEDKLTSDILFFFQIGAQVLDSSSSSFDDDLGRDGDDPAPGYEECNDPDRPPHSLVADDEDCHIFYQCVPDGSGGFIPYTHTCPEGTAFDETVQV